MSHINWNFKNAQDIVIAWLATIGIIIAIANNSLFFSFMFLAIGFLTLDYKSL